MDSNLSREQRMYFSITPMVQLFKSDLHKSFWLYLVIVYSAILDSFFHFEKRWCWAECGAEWLLQTLIASVSDLEPGVSYNYQDGFWWLQLSGLNAVMKSTQRVSSALIAIFGMIRWLESVSRFFLFHKDTLWRWDGRWRSKVTSGSKWWQ